MAVQSASTFEFVDNSGKVIPASRHLNPDGSVGGWVANDAVVSPEAIVEPGGVVEPRAVVRPHERVRRGETAVGPFP